MTSVPHARLHRRLAPSFHGRFGPYCSFQSYRTISHICSFSFLSAALFGEMRFQMPPSCLFLFLDVFKPASLFPHISTNSDYPASDRFWLLSFLSITITELSLSFFFFITFGPDIYSWTPAGILVSNILATVWPTSQYRCLTHPQPQLRLRRGN